MKKTMFLILFFCITCIACQDKECYMEKEEIEICDGATQFGVPVCRIQSYYKRGCHE